MSDPAPADLLRSLRDALGDRHVLTDPDLVAPYLVEQRGLYTGRAPAILRPGSTQEVASVVALCAAAGMPVVAQGGNTGLTGGGVPEWAVVISLERLGAVREVDPVGATITVGAGAILAQVQDAADQAGMLFPLTYASRGSARIGGGIATNAGGLNVLAYGNARDLVLGLEVVLPDGRIWDGLKALRKDNAGYDLKQLFIGAEGTLGIVTGVVLKLWPAQTRRATSWVQLAAGAPIPAIAALVRRETADLASAFELI